MTDRFCSRCGRKLVQREGEGNHAFGERGSCGRRCPNDVKIPSHDGRARQPRPPIPKRKAPPRLRADLKVIVVDFPDLADAIAEVVLTPVQARDASRWF